MSILVEDPFGEWPALVNLKTSMEIELRFSISLVEVSMHLADHEC